MREFCKWMVSGLIVWMCLGTSLVHAAGQLYFAEPFPTPSWGYGTQTITRLPNGEIFAYATCQQTMATRCGSGASTEYAEIALWNAGKRQWDHKPVADYREHFSSTVTRDGRVVMVGGVPKYLDVSVHSPLGSTVVFDSKTHVFSSGPTLAEPRLDHTVTELPSGDLLVVGGESALTPASRAAWKAGERTFPSGTQATASSTLLWDPKTGQWSASGDLPRGRTGEHKTTLLPNGDVLLSGGYDVRTEQVSELALWDHANGQWTNAGRMRHDLYRHSAALLPNGNVFLTTGEGLAVWSPTVEENAPGDWAPPRPGGYLTLLEDDTLLFMGGAVAGSEQPSRELNVWDFNAKRWQAAGRLNAAITDPGVLRLGDRRVLIFDQSKKGSLGVAALWNAKTGTVQPITLPPELKMEEISKPGWSPPSQHTWRALGLPDEQIMLITEDNTFIAPPPFKQWKTIQNAANPWPHVSPMSVLQNGNVLAFTSITQKRKERSTVLHYSYQYSRDDEFSVTEFDVNRQQWQAIASFREQRSKVDHRTVDGNVKAAAFAFLDTPVGSAELKDTSGSVLGYVSKAIELVFNFFLFLIVAISSIGRHGAAF